MEYTHSQDQKIQSHFKARCQYILKMNEVNDLPATAFTNIYNHKYNNISIGVVKRCTKYFPQTLQLAHLRGRGTKR